MLGGRALLRDGAERGLAELHAIADRDRLSSYPFYPAAMGELELRRGNREGARKQFQAALAIARNATERRFLEKRFRSCDGADAVTLEENREAKFGLPRPGVPPLCKPAQMTAE